MVLDAILRKSLLVEKFPTIQVPDETGRLLQLLVSMMRPQVVIELGTLFGYSTIYLARALPPSGRVVTVEVDPASARLAAENFRLAGIADRIELIVADALVFLKTCSNSSVDMVFIDAQKKSYPDYFDEALRVLRPGGLLLADDAFPFGEYQESSETSREAIIGIRAYNERVAHEPTLTSAFIWTETGLLISYKAESQDDGI